MLPYGIKAYLGTLIFLSPSRCPLGCRPQFFNLTEMLLIFCFCIQICLFFILPPAGKIACLNFNGAAVQHQYMVHTCIQQIPIVGYQDKTLLACQVFLDQRSCLPVQMIGGFIDEQEVIFTREQDGKHHLRPLPEAQCTKGPV